MRCNSAGSSVSAPTAEVAAQTAAAAVAGRDRLASGVGAGAAVGVPSATSTDRCVKTIIRNVIIPRIDPTNPNSSFKLDVRRALSFSPKPFLALVPYMYMYEYQYISMDHGPDRPAAGQG